MSQEYTLRILLTSSSNGLKSDFKFAKSSSSSASASASSAASAAVSIQEVKEHIYNNWPTEWSAENKTESVKNFRILYRGRFLLDTDTLDKLQIPLNEVTTMHLLIKIDTANATGGVGGKDGNKKKCLLM